MVVCEVDYEILCDRRITCLMPIYSFDMIFFKLSVLKSYESSYIGIDTCRCSRAVPIALYHTL